MPNEQQSFESYLSRILPFVGTPYDFKNKEMCIHDHIIDMVNRTHTMFKWENLPDTIPPRIIELYLQLNGNVCFYEYDGSLYVFVGGLGGFPDVYYMPTKYVISNPALDISKTLEIDVNCVVMANDTMYRGLMPLFRKYATMLTENELSMKIATVNSRLLALIAATDDKTKMSAEKLLEKIEKGEQGIIAAGSLFDENALKAQPLFSTTSNFLTNLIEFEQYCKASFYNDIGLNANYNMKRESLNSSESQMNNDALLPLVDDMLKCREIGVEKVNSMFGTNIKVSLASSWEDNEQEIEIEHGEIEQENLDNSTIENENDESEATENADDK